MTIVGEDLVLFERSLRHATASASGAALDEALTDLGWHDALADDPQVAVGLLFELQGAAGTSSSALDAVLATALEVERPANVAVVLPPLGKVAPPTDQGLATATVQRVEHAYLAGRGLVAVADLELRPITGLDPSLGLVAVTLAGPPAAPRDGWTDAVALGQRALAHELIGASRSMLELARVHALERVQFDRPIAGFQAVRHKLAEAYVAIESADGALAAAWEDGSPLTAAVAKAIAGRSGRLVAKHCQQVLAGIGFTIEHPFHHHMRRALTLDRLLGDAKSLTKAMGEELLRTRQVPPMLPL